MGDNKMKNLKETYETIDYLIESFHDKRHKPDMWAELNKLIESRIRLMEAESQYWEFYSSNPAIQSRVTWAK